MVLPMQMSSNQRHHEPALMIFMSAPHRAPRRLHGPATMPSNETADPLESRGGGLERRIRDRADRSRGSKHAEFGARGDRGG